MSVRKKKTEKRGTEERRDENGVMTRAQQRRWTERRAHLSDCCGMTHTLLQIHYSRAAKQQISPFSNLSSSQPQEQHRTTPQCTALWSVPTSLYLSEGGGLVNRIVSDLSAKVMYTVIHSFFHSLIHSLTSIPSAVTSCFSAGRARC